MPSGINDVLRAHQGAIKRYVNQQSRKPPPDPVPPITLTYTVAPGALVDGMTHLMQFNATCGASPTLNVNSLGAIPIHYLSNGTWVVVPSGAILANTVAKVAYNSAAGTYRIVSSSADYFLHGESISGCYTTNGGRDGDTPSDGEDRLRRGRFHWRVTFPIAFASLPMLPQITEGANNTGMGLSPRTSDKRIHS